MKKFGIVLIGILFSVSTQAQEIKPDDFGEKFYKVLDSNTVYDFVEVMPEFSGGDKGMMEYLKKNLKYPVVARENRVQGKVYLEFVIDKTGKVTAPKILRGVSKEIDEEALRLLNEMPYWKPGEHAGKKVNVRYNLPIVFSLV